MQHIAADQQGWNQFVKPCEVSLPLWLLVDAFVLTRTSVVISEQLRLHLFSRRATGQNVPPKNLTLTSTDCAVRFRAGC